MPGLDPMKTIKVRDAFTMGGDGDFLVAGPEHTQKKCLGKGDVVQKSQRALRFMVLL